jgi:hypothetical protein
MAAAMKAFNESAPLRASRMDFESRGRGLDLDDVDFAERLPASPERSRERIVPFERPRPTRCARYLPSHAAWHRANDEDEPGDPLVNARGGFDAALRWRAS